MTSKVQHTINYFFAFVIIFSLIFLCFSTIKTKNVPEKEAAHIINLCKSTKDDRCYVKQFAMVAKYNKLPYTLQVLSELQKQDPSVAGCHFIAHVVASEEVNKDPKGWQNIIKRLPINDCTGGYLMGLMEGRSKFEKDFKVNAATVQQICTQVNHAAGKDVDQTCFHVMGHLLLIETKGGLPQAVEMCNKLSEAYRYECYAGIFMENEYKRNLSAHGVGKPAQWDKDMLARHKKICNEYQADAARACWREIAHVFNFIYHNYPPDVYKACSEAGYQTAPGNAPNAEWRDDCYIHAVGVMAMSLKFDHQNFPLLCQPYEGNDLSYHRCAQMVITTLKQSSTNPTTLQKFCQAMPAKYKNLCKE